MEPEFDPYEVMYGRATWEPAAWVRQGMGRARQVDALTTDIEQARRNFTDKVGYLVTCGTMGFLALLTGMTDLEVRYKRLVALHEQRLKLAFDTDLLQFRRELEDDRALPAGATESLKQVTIRGAEKCEAISLLDGGLTWRKIALGEIRTEKIVDPVDPEQAEWQRAIDEFTAWQEELLALDAKLLGVEPDSTAAHEETVHGPAKPAKRPKEPKKSEGLKLNSATLAIIWTSGAVIWMHNGHLALAFMFLALAFTYLVLATTRN